MKFLLRIFTIFSLITFINGNLCSQENSFSREQNSVSSPVAIGIRTIELPEFQEARKNVHSANFQISLYVSDLDGYLADIEENDFLELSIRVRALDESDAEIADVFENTDYTLRVDEHNYQNLIFKDLMLYKTDDGGGNYDISVKSVEVEVRDFYGNDDLVSHSSLELTSIVDYGYDVYYDGTSPVAPPTNFATKVFDGKRQINLSWDLNVPYSSYELQLWRVPNIEASDQTIGSTSVTPDWDKALTLIVPVNTYNGSNVLAKKTVPVTIIEGSGIYVWRIRAIGGYHVKSYADEKNYGGWPSILTDDASITLSSTSENSTWFRFEDPDTSKNVIHSKIFTEGGKTKEVSTYADGLQNVKQTQTYLPSSESSIITQSEQDFSGRTSLTSIPIPVDGRPDAYKEKFMLNSAGDIYTAVNFDDPESGIPEQVLETGAFSYYNNNTDQRVPNSEGYPFIRTLYYNDGTGRIMEQSAPGETFAINEAGSGHTIKYYYGTASEVELTRLFGSEAPNHEKVAKSVVVDQNGVATTTYTTMEGNTIATSLTLSDDDLNNLSPLDTDPGTEMKLVEEKATDNIEIEEGFYSSKRFILTQPTDITINYEVDHNVLDAGCASVEINCNFTLEISIADLNTGSIEVIYPVDPEGANSVDGYPAVGITVNRPAGSYLVQKKIIPGNPKAKVNRKELENKIVPLADLLGVWMKKVTCNSNAEAYYSSLNVLWDNFNNHTLDALPANSDDDYFGTVGVEDWNSFVSSYSGLTSEEKALYIIQFYKYNEAGDELITSPLSTTNIPDYAIVYSTCCIVSFGTKYVPHINFDPATWGYNTTEGKYYPDFEGYAKDYLEHCLTPASEHYFYDLWMLGWPEGTFNEMVYRMLTDTSDDYRLAKRNLITEAEQIENGNQTVNGNDKVEYDECGNPIPPNTENDYKIYELFNCWEAALMKLQAELGCTPMTASYGVGDDQKGRTLADLVDEDQEDGKPEDEPTQDQHMDENFTMGGSGLIGRAIRWYMNRKMSKRMRDNSPAAGDADAVREPGLSVMHLVEEFLGCTGYKFGKVITPLDPYPLSLDKTIDVSGTDPNSDLYTKDNVIPPYTLQLEDGIQPASYYTDFPQGDRRPYVPLTWEIIRREIIVDEHGDGERIAIPSESPESIFPNIKNPIYAFKYFEYPSHGNAPYNELEASTCFDDPNDCFATNTEGDVIIDNVTKKPIKIPCCAEPHLLDIEEGCYKDHDYPLLETADISDPRFGTDAEGKYRYVVQEFTDKGRLRCKYDHDEWSSGERYAFYQALKHYRNPEDSWDTEISDVNENCEFFTGTASKWWYMIDPLSPSGSSGFFPGESPPEPTGYAEMDYSDYYLFDKESERDRLTMVEIQMASKRNKCLRDCEQNKNETRKELINTLERNCYDIGGCYTVQTPWAVPESHIDSMLARLNDQCLSQCPVYTFGCEDIDVLRDLKTHRSELGAISELGGYSNLYVGVSFYPFQTLGTVCDELPLSGNFIECQENRSLWSNNIDLNDDGSSDVIRVDIETREKSDYSWYEYTRLKQVSEWKIELSIPPMCETRYPGEGIPNPEGFLGTEPNTFVPKDEYEVPTHLLDVENIRVGDPVTSPAINIEVETEGQ